MSEENSNIDQERQLFPQNDTGGNDGQDNVGNANNEPAPAKEPATQDVDAQKPGSEGKPAEQGKEPASAGETFDPAALKVPDGFTVDPAVLDEFAGKIKAMNLTQTQAQELVDLQVKAGQAQLAEHARVRQAWVGELKADPEYGGAAFENTVQDAQAVMRRFDADGKVLEMLCNSGFGDNPAIIKMLANIKRSMSEDQFVSDRGGNLPEEKSLAERLWPDPLK